MQAFPRTWRGVTASMLAVALLGAACGDASDPGELVPAAQTDLTGEPDLPAVTTVPAVAAPAETPATTPAEPSEGPAAPPPPSDLPDVTVVDLGGGEVSLPTLAPSDRPILLWFWAPH